MLNLISNILKFAIQQLTKTTMYLRKGFLLFLLSTTLMFSCNSQESFVQNLESPNSEISLDFSLNNEGIATYLVSDADGVLVNKSVLGFELLDKEDLFKDFEIIDIKHSNYDDTWTRVWGESKVVRNSYNEMKVVLKKHNDSKLKLNIYFRVYNDGIAFRYEIPKQKGLSKFVISDEKTEFAINDVNKTWWIKADYDSYEKLYEETLLEDAKWVATPFTLNTTKGKYLSIHEANLTNYAGMTLKQNTNGAFESELVPWANGDKVRCEGVMISPWRTIQISNTAAELIESNLIVNLNEPNKLEDVSWIKPMTYIGIWWGMHIGTETWVEGNRHGATTANAIKHIDFAKKNGVGGVVIEGWNKGWDKWGQKDAFDHITPANDFDFEYVAKYAKTNGVSLIGHNETGGDIESYERFMEQAFALYEKYGMNSVKTGYAGGIIPRGEHHHGQYMVNHYRRVVKLAAKHKLMLDVHEPIKPTGIRRTYPNMMTREGVRGMEWNAWSDGNAPNHTLILPFTRMLGGPIDYTAGVFDVELKNFANDRVKWNTEDIGKTRVHTTLTKQLALMVILYSPMQMAADVVDNYENEKAFDFVSELKTTWDESKILNGEIGKYITVARKSGEQWFLGSATNETARKLEINLDFLDANKNYKAVIYKETDGSNWLKNPSKYIIETKKVNSGSKMVLDLPEGGGQAVIFTVE